MVGGAIKQIAEGEVGKLQSRHQQEAGLAPSHRQLDLVVGLRGELPLDVHGTTLLVGNDIGDDLLLIEVTHLCNHTHGTHDVVAIEEHARLCVELAANHLVVDLRVSSDRHLIDRRRLALVDADVEGN